MATAQLSKAETTAWLARFGKEASYDYVARRGGYTVRATRIYGPNTARNSIWLDHFTTEAAAQTAIQMMKPKSASDPGAVKGSLFDDDAPAS